MYCPKKVAEVPEEIKRLGKKVKIELRKMFPRDLELFWYDAAF